LICSEGETLTCNFGAQPFVYQGLKAASLIRQDWIASFACCGRCPDCFREAFSRCPRRVSLEFVSLIDAPVVGRES
jgi:hypothetical protein